MSIFVYEYRLRQRSTSSKGDRRSNVEVFNASLPPRFSECLLSANLYRV